MTQIWVGLCEGKFGLGPLNTKGSVGFSSV